MQPQRLYQRPLNFTPPPGLPASAAPSHSHPIPLTDGRTLLTLLFAAPSPHTLILELSPTGHGHPWPPALGYPAPILFYANPHDDLIGLDLLNPGKLYACRPDGTHLWTLETSLLMATPLTPQLFHQQDNHLFWLTADNTPMTADLQSNTPTNLRNSLPLPSPAPTEIHHPHTHLTPDGSLYVLDFTPPPQITRYRLV